MLIQADARSIPLRDGCVQCVVTSPPYFGLRDYGTGTWVGGDPDCNHLRVNDQREGVKQVSNRGTVALAYGAVCAVCAVCAAERVDAQIGLEPTPDAYVQTIVAVFREVWRVLAEDGVCWLNLGDSYATAGGYGGDDCPSNADSKSRSNRGARHKGQRARVIGFKHKDLLGIPWMVAFALRDAGWYLRSDVIWAKPNPMPESVTDRPTKSHEYLFLLTKSSSYYYDAKAIAEPVSDAMLQQMDQGYDGLGLKDYEAVGVQNPSSVKARIIANARTKAQQIQARGDRQDGDRQALRTINGQFGEGMCTRNKRSVWTIPTMPYSGAHFATMPEALVEPCILAGSRLGDLVFDPFMGSGTVGAVAERLGRRWVGTDLNPAYHALARERTAQRGLRFEELGA